MEEWRGGDFYGFLFQGAAQAGTHLQWPRVASEQRSWDTS